MIIHCKYTYTLTKRDKNYFKQCIKNQNITQRDFAKKIGISNTLLTYLLSGERTMTYEMLEKFEKNGIDFLGR